MTKPIIEYFEVSKTKGRQQIKREMTDTEFEAYQARCAIADAERELKEKYAYAEKRAAEYPPVGDQLDAIWKELNFRRLNGDNLVSDADEIINKVLSVKEKYPKLIEK